MSYWFFKQIKILYSIQDKNLTFNNLGFSWSWKKNGQASCLEIQQEKFVESDSLKDFLAYYRFN